MEEKQLCLQTLHSKAQVIFDILYQEPIVATSKEFHLTWFPWNIKTHLHREYQRAEDGAPQHVVVQRRLPQGGEVLQQVPAVGADRHAHTLDQETEDVQD